MVLFDNISARYTRIASESIPVSQEETSVGQCILDALWAIFEALGNIFSTKTSLIERNINIDKTPSSPFRVSPEQLARDVKNADERAKRNMPKPGTFVSFQATPFVIGPDR